MTDHIGLAVTDIARSRAFYEAGLAPLGIRTIRVNGMNIEVVCHLEHQE